MEDHIRLKELDQKTYLFQKMVTSIDVCRGDTSKSFCTFKTVFRSIAEKIS
jgi:hypothetical protein